MSIKLYKEYLCLLVHTFLRVVPIKPTERYDVVIVRSDAIGDFVMWLSCMPAYRQFYRGKKILLVCPDANRAVAEASGYFDSIITFNRKKVIDQLSYQTKFMLQLKKIQADVLYNPSWAHQNSADDMCAMIQAPLKYGAKIKRIGPRAKWCDTYFTNLIEMPIKKDLSEFEANQHFTQETVDKNFKYHLSDLSFLIDQQIHMIDGAYCIIALSSSVPTKIWPIENVLKVLDVIPRNISIVLSGYGKEDICRANYLIERDKSHHFENYVNKTTIPELINLISHAKFLLGNDSAAVHIAASCRVPSICYTHGAQFKRFVPYPDFLPDKFFHPRCVFHKMECYGCNYYCTVEKNTSKPLLCLRKVKVEDVIGELKKLLLELDIL